MNRQLRHILLTFCAVLISGSLLAQDIPTLESGRYEVVNISFVGNEAKSEKELLDVISTKETPAGLWTFIYQNVSERIGREPQYYDPALFSGDLVRLRQFYRDNGFFGATVDTTIDFDVGKLSVSLSFIISEGALSLVDSVRYEGLRDLPPEISTEISEDPRLERGKPYNSLKAAEEQARILSALQNNGYPNAHYDSARIDRKLSDNNVIVSFSFVHGRRYFFGKPEIKIEGGEEFPIARIVVLRQLDFEEGEPYSIRKKFESERNLNRLGIFDFAWIDTPFPAEPDSSDHVPTIVVLRPREKHEIAPEIVVNNQNNAFNVGLGIGYTNRNTFGGAQTFTTKVTGLAQSISLSDSVKGIRRGTAELSAQLVQPYFFTNKLSLDWVVSLNIDKQVEYFQTILKNNIGVINKFPTNTFLNYGFVDLTLERVDTRLNLDTTRITDSTLLAGIRNLRERQFNSILSATLQGDKTNDIFSPTSGSFFSVTLEEAGLLPSLLIADRAKYPYSLFVKGTLVGKWYAPMSRDTITIFASKMKVGVAQPYGAETDRYPIPLNRRFFAGGSGSVRGWRTRELGVVTEPSLGGNALLEGNAELRVHLFPGDRENVINWDKVWGVIFLDFGNIWEKWEAFRVNQIAVAAGFGLRYNLFFGPIRVDFGFRVYESQNSGVGTWIFERRFLKETLAQGVLHFGIGQAF
jgi:outer membrane protein assembly complex protein YaeT